MHRQISLAISILAVASLAAAGCSRDGDFVKYESAPASESSAAGHNHPSEGPHHGDLVELGNEEYHAEVVHDDAAGTLTVYILDSEAKQQVAIDATELTINISHEGTAEQFTLIAKPDESDAEGKSSRFASDNQELAADLDDHDAEPELVVMIDGKSYRGTIHHGHDHDDDHGDHKDGRDEDPADHHDGDDADHGHE